MLVVVLNMPEHSSFQDMLFPMLFISKYAKSYASIMDISLDSVVESGVCGCVSELDIAWTGAVYIKVYGGTLRFFLPDARAHDQSGRQKTALLQAEIRKAVKKSVVAGSSFDRFLSDPPPKTSEVLTGSSM